MSEGPAFLPGHSAGFAHSWSPRECLLEALRMLNAGEVDPIALTVCMLELDDKGGSRGLYRVSSPNVATTLGMIELIKREMFTS